MHIQRIRQRLRALGARPAHEERVLRHWAHALPQDAGRRRIEDFLPLALGQGLQVLMDVQGGCGQLRARGIAGAVQTVALHPTRPSYTARPAAMQNLAHAALPP